VKLFALNCVLVCSISLFMPLAGSSQDTIPSRVHTSAVGTDRAAIGFAADRIVREDGPTRYNSLIHLRGNVEIRTCFTQPPGRSQTGARAYMVMRADEADYDGEKGEIEARGTVRVSFQDAK
jgi:lipopolysaccharide assembly outer membrane protein LptD (OstA)